jgi:hypothetical protein
MTGMTENAGSAGPKDPSKLVFVLFYWLGIGTLLPWNFFLAGKCFRSRSRFYESVTAEIY